MASAGVRPFAARAVPVGVDAAARPGPGGAGAGGMLPYCVQRHRLPPSMHTAAEWRNVLKRRGAAHEVRRGGMFARAAMPSAADWHTLREYLDAHSQRPSEPFRIAA